MTLPTLSEAGRLAIEGIDDLILLLNKLLQIAEAESGMRTETFDRVDLSRVVRDMVELYDAAAEEADITLCVSSEASVWAKGDHDLLASAVASLIDNAIKYAGAGSQVELATETGADYVSIIVRDNGPGVPEEELLKLPDRFYRMDRARHQPGNGLGLAIVTAIASLHSGKLVLENAHPGLRASILLAAADSSLATRSSDDGTPAWVPVLHS
jgi:signal transduction histidine kinase